MKKNLQGIVNGLKKKTVTIGVAVILGACGFTQVKQPEAITIDGSSTVYPITQKLLEKFNTMNRANVEVTATFSGTGGGFKKFCAGETDINNASRPILQDEMEACKQNKRKP